MCKAIQIPLHSFIDDYDWKMDHKEFGAGAIIIIMLYNNHIIIKRQSQPKLA